jgi:hypothetical protein
MTSPEAGPTRDPRRERLIALLLLGIAAVLLVSSVTWFGTGQQVVGIGQVVLGVVLAVVGGLLYRRATR